MDTENGTDPQTENRSMTDIERKMNHFEQNAPKCRPHKARPKIGFDGVHYIECGQGCRMHDGEHAAMEPLMMRWEAVNL